MNTKYKFEDYRFEIRPLSAEDGGGFFITFPDLPGCMSDGETYDETISNARDAFSEWVASKEESGQEVPSPNAEGKPTKFLLRLPKSVHESAAALARVEGTSLNTLYAVLVSEAMAFRAGRMLSQAHMPRFESTNTVPISSEREWASGDTGYWTLASGSVEPATHGTSTAAEVSLTKSSTGLLASSPGSFSSLVFDEVVPAKRRALS